jgi:flagellar motor switch protein FliN
VNTESLQTFAEGYLSGFFGTVGLALSLDPTYGVEKVTPFEDDAVADLSGAFSAVMGGPVSGGGRIAVLMQSQAAYAITAAVAEADLPQKDAIDEADMPQLSEALGACLGGGAGYFKETYGNPVELESIEIAAIGPEAFEAFKAAGPGCVAEFWFDVPDITHGKGALLISEVLADAVSDTEPEGDASLTKDEVDDILSDFDNAGADQESAPAAYGSGGGHGDRPPENLGRVLDIQLTATARLGRIEMPIQEILSLGPGSIVEVGHVVDEPVELLVNNKLIARGDVVVVDEKFGLRITEIISPEERIESLS